MDIEVVLTETDPKLGKRGQVIKVSPGYAQNFLFPHNKAKPATAANLKHFEQEKARLSQEEAERLSTAKALAGRVAAVRLSLGVPAGEGDKLFGSVTSQDIVEALAKQGIAVDRKKLHLEEPIKKLGVYEVSLKLHAEVHTVLKIEIVKKEGMG